MTQQFGKHSFDQASKIFKEAFTPANFQALAEHGLTASKSFYDKAATTAQDHGKALTEIADTAWGTTKLLNEHVVQNLAANFEATFAAAQRMAAAKSLPEIAKLQSEYLQLLTAQATEQTKEFVDLSTRASQLVLEKLKAASTKSFTPGA